MRRIYDIGGIIVSVVVGLPAVLVVLLPILLISIAVIWLLGKGFDLFIKWWLGLW